LNTYKYIGNVLFNKYATVLISAMCLSGQVVAANISKQNTGEHAISRRSDAEISAASNELGLIVLNKKRASGETLNQVVSPWGLSNTLGMLSSATSTQTSSEIYLTFQGRIFSKKKFGQQIKSVNQQLGAGQRDIIFKNANRLWIAKSLTETIKPALVSELQDIYASDATPFVSSDSSSASTVINTWVNQVTNGQIPSIVNEQTMSKNVKAVGVNAVYFNGEWLKPFVQSDNRMLNFKMGSGEVVAVPAMIGTINAKIFDQADFSVIEIPFKNQNFAMMILLPAESSSLHNVLNEKLSGSNFIEFIDNGRPAEINLELPKFRITPKPDGLKTILGDLGINQVFSQGADFSPLSNSPSISIDDIYHAAGIRVDEVGVEAKSSSAAVLTAKSMKLDLRKISINRSFLFAVMYKPSATTLFIGSIEKPEP
jgi:serine protease inhibitor